MIPAHEVELQKEQPQKNNTRICFRCKIEKTLDFFHKAKNEKSGYGYCCKKCTVGLRKKRKNKEKPLDFIGKKYPNSSSNITIVKDLGTAKEKGGNFVRTFLVRCDCGFEKSVRANHLKGGNVKSCGRVECEYSVYGRRNKESVIIEDKQFGFTLAKCKYDSIIASAKKRKLEFSITPADILEIWKQQDGKCYYTGLKLLSDKFHSNTKNNTWSLDRIDNDFGYEKGNIIIVHKTLNIMRGSMRIKSFITAAHLIARYYDRHKEKVLSMTQEEINDMFQNDNIRMARGRKSIDRQ